MASNNWFPTGGLRVIPGSEVALPIDFSDLLGILKVTVLPPRSGLFFPILPLRLDNGRLVFPLCRSCAEEEDHDAEEECSHEDSERAWTATFVSPELRLAVEHGYVVTEVYEIWNFTEKENDLFDSYVRCFSRQKYANSKMDPSEIEAFVRELREEEGIHLTPEEIGSLRDPNAARRTIAKILLVSLYGKFGQSSEKSSSTTEYIKSAVELRRLIRNPQIRIDNSQLLKVGGGSLVASFFSPSFRKT